MSVGLLVLKLYYLYIIDAFVNEVHLEDLQILEEKIALPKINNSPVEGVR